MVLVTAILHNHWLIQCLFIVFYIPGLVTWVSLGVSYIVLFRISTISLSIHLFTCIIACNHPDVPLEITSARPSPVGVLSFLGASTTFTAAASQIHFTPNFSTFSF